jgi:DNA-directed RNA polymerase specialized sigma24 family protein
MSSWHMNDSVPLNRQSETIRRSAEGFLRRFGTDETAAGAKYESLRRRLVKFFECSHCVRPEDLADEVFDRMVAKPETETIHNLDGYAIAVARFVFMETLHKMRREVYSEDLPGGQNSLPDIRDASTELVERLDREKRISFLRKCLVELSHSDRELAIQYYDAEEKKHGFHRQKLAEKFALTIDALRVRMNRIRKRLEECVSRALNSHLKRSGTARS